MPHAGSLPTLRFFCRRVADRSAAERGQRRQSQFHDTYQDCARMTNESGPLKPIGQGTSTLAVHAGEQRQKYGDAITDAIFCASTYTFPDTQSVVDFIEQKLPREEYGRYGNPAEKIVERKLAALEGGEAALL